MLHHYQTVSKRQIPCVGQIEAQPPELELLTFLYNIYIWLEAAPAVYSSAEGKTVYILYDNTAFLIDDFLDSFSLPCCHQPFLADLCFWHSIQSGDRTAFRRTFAVTDESQSQY